MFCYILSCSGKEFTVQEVDDVEFFINAMKRCCNNHHDVELAFRIDALVNTGNNVVLLGDSRLESMYYLLFMRLVCMFETMDKIMEVIVDIFFFFFFFQNLKKSKTEMTATVLAFKETNQNTQEVKMNALCRRQTFPKI